MTQPEADRRIRLVIDVVRRPLAENERERHAAAIAATPNAIPRDYAYQWAARIRAVEGDAEPIAHPNFASATEEDEKLRELITFVTHDVGVMLARELSGRQIPVDPRFAELVGCGRVPTRSELAKRLALTMGLHEPTHEASEGLLVDIALLAHRWYDNPDAPTESTEVGHGIVSAAQKSMSPEDFAAALDDLGVREDHLEREVELWTLAADLVKRMGVPIW